MYERRLYACRYTWYDFDSPTANHQTGFEERQSETWLVPTSPYISGDVHDFQKGTLPGVNIELGGFHHSEEAILAVVGIQL